MQIKGAPYKAIDQAVRRGIVYKIETQIGAVLHEGNLEETA